MRKQSRKMDNIANEEQEERVEELSAEYEEFLRESAADPNAPTEEEERSIIMVDPDPQL